MCVGPALILHGHAIQRALLGCAAINFRRDDMHESLLIVMYYIYITRWVYSLLAVTRYKRIMEPMGQQCE